LDQHSRRTAEEDRLERLPLLVRRALVEVEDERPRRTLLVVAVAQDEDDRQSGQVDAGGVTSFDLPGEGAEADPVRGAPTRLSVDASARADRVAVARLEVAAGDPPRFEHRLSLRGVRGDASKHAPMARRRRKRRLLKPRPP